MEKPVNSDFSSEQRLLERMKELDLAHRNRLRRSARLALSLRFLRTAFTRLCTPTVYARPVLVPRPATGQVAITFVGHATVMLTTARLRVLTDPLFGNFLLGLRRARAAVLAAADLAEVGLVAISHAHRDRLHLSSLRRVPRSATVIVPPRCADLVSGLGFARTIELAVGHKEIVNDMEVTAVAARHDGVRGGFDLVRRAAQGYVFRADGRCIYFAGDTGYFSGFAEIGERYRPEIALLPIAGYEPLVLRAEHMSPLDAAYAVEDLRSAVLVPVAFGSYPLSYEPIEAPLAWLRQIAAERRLEGKVQVLDHGQTLLVPRAKS